MRKLLCIMLVFLLLLGILPAQRASAAENHWDLFSEAINTLYWYAPFWDVPEGSAFPMASIMNYTRQHLTVDEYGEELIIEGAFSYYARYAIPAEVFEAMAMDSFAMVDVEAMHSYTSFFWDHVSFTGIDNFRNYQPDRDVYVFSSTGTASDPSFYEVLGYTEADGLYTVYSRLLSPAQDAAKQEPGGEYVEIDGASYAVDHYLRTVMAVCNDRAQFHSWEELALLPDVPLITPTVVLAQNETLTLTAGVGALPSDAAVEILTPEGEALAQLEETLSGLADGFVPYEITADAQPKGTVKAVFAIPSDFEAEKLALLCIAPDGSARRLDAAVDTEAGTLTAELTQFGLFALAQLADEAPPRPGDADGNGKINVRDVRRLLQYLAGLTGEGEVRQEAADFNGDGDVNVRDLRAMLLYLAGMENDS